MKKLVVLISALVLSACVGNYELLKTGDKKMWGSYTVASSEDINELKTDELISWTQYGPLLEQIRFFKPVADGKLLPYTMTDDQKKKSPKYRSGMTPEEFVEVYRSTNMVAGTVITNISELQIMNAGGVDGYSFEVNASSRQGKDYKALVYFTEQNGKLYMIEYGAHATHYYSARKPFAKDVLASLKFL